MSTPVHARGGRGTLTRRDAIRSSLAGLAGATAAAMLPLRSVLAQSSPSPAPPFTADQRAVAERILQREVDSGAVPGIGWSIGDASGTLAEGGVGLRVVSPAVPVGVATRFAIASVSKQFTAACIFLLRDQGKLSLDAPLSDYLPDYQYASKVTLRRILTMSSGIPSDMEACEAPIGNRLDDTVVAENLNRLEPDFAPGAHFTYNSCGYDLAGALVAKLSGMSFARFVEEHIFKPLRMSSSYQLGTRDDLDFAEGYVAEGDGWKLEPATAADRIFASGNLASNASDMQRWDRALLNATLLSRKSLDEMFAVPTLSSGAETIYASGWFIEPNGVVWHGGALLGYGAANVLIPGSGHAIVLLGNTAPFGRWEPWDVAREIYNTLGLGPTLSAFRPIVFSTVPK
jgi:CubicO group peptidase (beta-lactamase class C family)